MERSQVKPAWMHVVVPITLIVVQEMGYEKHIIGGKVATPGSRVKTHVKFLAQSVLIAGLSVKTLGILTGGMVIALNTLKMHVTTLLVQYVLMVVAWASMVSAPVADFLLIATQYIVSLNIHSDSFYA